ncbi:PH domain-containing protein [Streptomyces nigra]
MNSVPQVTCRTRSRRPLWFFVGLGVAGLVLAVARLVGTGGVPDRWVAAGACVLVPIGFVGMYGLAVRVHADARGLSYRTLLRRRSVAWGDVADVRVHVQYVRNGELYRVHVVTRGGRTLRLPCPSERPPTTGPSSTPPWRRCVRCTASTAHRSRTISPC